MPNLPNCPKCNSEYTYEDLRKCILNYILDNLVN
ncbi:hypothetical protein ACW7GP_07200, partial [Bacillus cereus]